MTVPGTLAIYAGAALAEIAGCFAVWGWMRQGASALWLVPGLLSLAVFAWLLTLGPSDFAGRAYAAYGGGLYRRLAPLAVAHRETASRHLGPDRCRNLPGRRSRDTLCAEGDWRMIGGALQGRCSRLPLIVADLVIGPAVADRVPPFQRSSHACKVKSMT